MSSSNSRSSPRKRTLTLDLNSSSGKKTAGQHILTSPDVQMLKLTSPEMAEFLTRNPTLTTPTPSGYTFPKTVTEEQEMYVKGFEDALKKMHQSANANASSTTATFDEAAPNATSIEAIEKATAAHRAKVASAGSQDQVSPRPSSSASGSMDSSDAKSFLGALEIKEEADEEFDFEDDDDDDDDKDFEELPKKKTRGRARKGVDVSPINMESQERIKLERKRMRNRLAASKCRKRKLERISQLEAKVKSIKGENSELAAVVKKLKESVCSLKQEVLEHVHNGCQIALYDDSLQS